MKWNTLLKGAGLGAALMYLFDPDRGRRRRALLLDQYDHAVHNLEDFLAKAQRDMKNRAAGITHEAGAMFRRDDADDRVIGERVRSKLGRYVSHPHAISVESQNGHIILSGPILAEEAEDLICAVRHVRGVKAVESRLEIHQERGRYSALQGGKTPPGEPYELAQYNWSPATRAVAQLTGLVLMGNCLARRNVSSMLLGTAGFAMFMRGASNRSLAQLIGTKAVPQAAGFQRTVTIQAPVEKVWDFMTDFEEIGKFLPEVKSVQHLGNGQYRWGFSLPGGQVLELEERITENVPHERLSWESISQDPVWYRGTVRLQREGDNATRVNVHFAYTPPGGALGDKLASLFGLDPESQFHDAVNRIKTFLETGQPPHDVHEIGTESRPITG